MLSKHSGIMIVSLAAAGWLAGCSSPVKLDQPAPVETRSVAPSQAASGPSQSGVATVDTTTSQALGGNTLGNVIYFDFDSDAVKDTYRPIVESNAALLKADRTKREVAEGHTDERGGSEYNLALGQRRAEAVVRQMTLLGVADNQVEAVSYGKERPADPGHDESAWAKNRRVELRSK